MVLCLTYFRRKFSLYYLKNFFTVILFLFILLYFQIKNDEQSDSALESQDLGLHADQTKQSFDEKFITATPVTCGGLGNIMWRFASLYAIGRHLNRTAYFDTSLTCMLRFYREAQDIFPTMARLLRFERRYNNEKVLVEFGKHCCKYDNTKRLEIIKDKYIQLTADYLQAYEYLDLVGYDSIRKLFKCSNSVLSENKRYYRELVGNDTQHKLCVHTRIGDFKILDAQSTSEFTENSMDYASYFLKKKFGPTSVIMLGQDKDFIKSIKFDRSLINAIYYPKEMKRGEDLCFSVTYCDSLLITAQHSTYAWWIGYLLNENSDKNNTNSFVFYNSNFLFDGVGHGYQNFLPNWIPLRYFPPKKIVEM